MIDLFLISYIFLLFIFPFHPNIRIPILRHSSPQVSYGTDEENLFDDQELLYLVMISFIPVTLVCDSWVILYGEIRRQSLS